MAECQLKTKTLYLSVALQLTAGSHWFIYNRWWQD